MEESDAGNRRSGILNGNHSITIIRKKRLWHLSYIIRRIPVRRKFYTRGSGPSIWTAGELVYLSKTMSIELGVLGGGRVSFAHDDDTGDWYICRTTDDAGFIVWKDKRCARFSAGFIVQKLMQQAKVERKSVQFMMAKTPMEVNGTVYYKILLSNPILR